MFWPRPYQEALTTRPPLSRIAMGATLPGGILPKDWASPTETIRSTHGGGLGGVTPPPKRQLLFGKNGMMDFATPCAESVCSQIVPGPVSRTWKSPSPPKKMFFIPFTVSSATVQSGV